MDGSSKSSSVVAADQSSRIERSRSSVDRCCDGSPVQGCESRGDGLVSSHSRGVVSYSRLDPVRSRESGRRHDSGDGSIKAAMSDVLSAGSSEQGKESDDEFHV